MVMYFCMTCFRMVFCTVREVTLPEGRSLSVMKAKVDFSMAEQIIRGSLGHYTDAIETAGI